MTTSILQVRDVPEDALAKLRARASAQGISLSQYVRDLLTHDAEEATIAEVVERITGREPVDITDAEILDAIHDGRR